MSAIPVESLFNGNLKALSDAPSSGNTGTNNSNNKLFLFEQKVPIPSYLLAIVCGELARKEISERCAIWSEPGRCVEEAAFEFAESEEFLQIAEEITGLEYQWGRY